MRSASTVRDLIILLFKEDPNAEVRLSYDWGDYGRSEVAVGVDSVSVRRLAIAAGPGGLDCLVSREDEDVVEDDEDGNKPTAVVLRGVR